MTPNQLPGMFMLISTRVDNAAGPVVLGMANAYQRRVQRVTLRKYSNVANMPTPSPIGEPPAWVSGDLARSVEVTPGILEGPVATASVAPHMVYARIQELGGIVRPVRARFLRFPYAGRIWYKKFVRLHEHPYMRPTTEDMVADGSFTGTAMAVFEAVVWGKGIGPRGGRL